jgi:L-threonylcarbamoyladenylate synthase
MGTEVLQIDGDGDLARAVGAAVKTLARGGLVVLPTETVYGVAARADLLEAVERLRKVKARRDGDPFTIHIGAPEEAKRYVPHLGRVAQRLMRKGWPGPLTLILPTRIEDAPISRERGVSASFPSAPDQTVGLRCPDHPLAGAVLRAVGAPVVASSANRADQPPPRTAAAALEQLNGDVDLLIDAGPTKYSKPSTIVRLEGDACQVVRAGVYDEQMIRDLAALRILFVCTGNTCRSPMAAAIAKRMLAQRLQCQLAELERRHVIVDSAGTAGGAAGAADNAIAVLNRRGLDISGHRSKPLTPELIERADHVFVMTRAHHDAVIRAAPSAADRASLLLADEELADPFGGSQEQYEHCAQAIEKAMAERIKEVML